MVPERVYVVTDGLHSIAVTASNASAAGLNEQALGYLLRRSVDYKYCEARYGSPFSGRVSMIDAAQWREAPGAPFYEYGAVISAVFIAICGMHMLVYWRHDCGVLHLISALFISNGVTAALAHYSSLYVWQRIDGLSMALAAWLTVGFLLEELLQSCHVKRRHEGRRAVERTCSWTSAIALYWWFSEANGKIGPRGTAYDVEIGEEVDSLIIVLPLMLSGALAGLVVQKGCGLRNEYVDPAVADTCRRLFVRGFIIAIIAVSAWVTTEQLCDSVKWLRWFPVRAPVALVLVLAISVSL